MRDKFRREGKFFVYIVKCADGTYYTGYTNDLEERLKRHNKGLASKYTRSRLPVTLVWKKEYRQYKSAFKTERAIKKLTRRQKEALVSGRRLGRERSRPVSFKNPSRNPACSILSNNRSIL